jgi:LuxR family maltose regulon positive regulatory protein
VRPIGRATWVALDQSDNEPKLFRTYFIAALQTVHAQVGTRALSLLRSLQPLPVETLLGTLLNELSATSYRVVLVLDDYHLIGAQPVHQGISFLLDHLPPPRCLHARCVIPTTTPRTTLSCLRVNAVAEACSF